MQEPNPPRHPAWPEKDPEVETAFTREWRKKHAHRWVVHGHLYYPIGTLVQDMQRPPRGPFGRRW